MVALTHPAVMRAFHAAPPGESDHYARPLQLFAVPARDEDDIDLDSQDPGERESTRIYAAWMLGRGELERTPRAGALESCGGWVAS